LLLTLLPFLVIVVFTYDKISEQKVRVDYIEALDAKMNQLENIYELTHELQKERDLAVKFVSYPVMSVDDALRKQLQITDSVEAYYRTFIIEHNLDTSDFYYLNTFQKVRESLTNFSFVSGQVESDYKVLIRYYMDLVASCASQINTVLTKEEIMAFLSLSEAKEGLGKIRYIIDKALHNGGFKRLEYGMFSGEKATFEYNLNSFIKRSPDDFRIRFQIDLQDGAMMNALDIINYCFENGTNDLVGFTSKEWWISSKGMINHFRELELYVLKSIKGSLVIKKETIQSEKDFLYLILLTCLFGFLILVIFITKSIILQWKKIESITNKVNLAN